VPVPNDRRKKNAPTSAAPAPESPPRAYDHDDESDLEGLDHPSTFEAVVRATDLTTETILKQTERERLKLDPEFQRRDARTRSQKSRFVESLIANVPIPQLVLENERVSEAVTSCSMASNGSLRSGSSLEVTTLMALAFV
jgi:hypothetical protein